MPRSLLTSEMRSQRPARPPSAVAARSLPRCASGGILQDLQGLRTIHAGAPYEVDRRGVDLVDERVDAQVARQVLVLLQERAGLSGGLQGQPARRSEEHTSELQSRQYLVCCLLLEKKNDSLRQS